ncbi:hypothetical protein [Lentzea sp. CC55]|nr:hypothetical protein [Lentzea sp. CC55]
MFTGVQALRLPGVQIRATSSFPPAATLLPSGAKATGLQRT